MVTNHIFKLFYFFLEKYSRKGSSTFEGLPALLFFASAAYKTHFLNVLAINSCIVIKLAFACPSSSVYISVYPAFGRNTQKKEKNIYSKTSILPIMETITLPKIELEQLHRELETLRNSGLYKRLLEFEKNISEGKRFTRADLGF